MIYNQASADFLNNTHDWDNAAQTYKVMLITTGYTINLSHVYVSQISQYEISGNNYQPGFSGTGRKSLINRFVNVDNTNNYSYITADNVSWTNLNTNPSPVVYAVIYRHSTNDSGSKLVFVITGGTLPVVPNGGNFNLNWNASGIAIVRNA